MAKSFALLGEPYPAEELLLYLLSSKPSTRRVFSPRPSGDDNRTVLPKKTILYCDEGTAKLGSDDFLDMERSILWQVYHISTLAEDWATSLATAEELARCVGNDDMPMARVAFIFALLQCHRPSVAMEKCIEWKHKEVRGALGAMFSSFEADGLIMNNNVFTGKEVSVKGNRSGSIEYAKKIYDKCQAAVDQLENAWNQDRDSEDNCSGSVDLATSREFNIAMENNRGISLVLTGRTKEALAAFEEASIDRRSTKTSRDMSWLLFRPRFNLALLLWREGYRNEAAKVWMGTRKLGDEASSTNKYLSKDLRAVLQEAISRHGLFCAKKKASGRDSMSNVARENVTLWLPTNDKAACYAGESGTHVLGLSLEQVLAFDVVVLQHTVAERSKRG